MKRIGRRLVLRGLGASALFAPIAGRAFGYGTREAVIEMVEAAAAVTREYGFAGALRQAPAAVWRRPDLGLYIFAMDGEGTLLLHPDKRAEGQNVSGSHDPKGTYFIREIIRASARRPEGSWTLYLWPDPVTGNLVPKRTFAMRAGGVILCAGYAGADV